MRDAGRAGAGELVGEEGDAGRPGASAWACSPSAGAAGCPCRRPGGSLRSSAYRGTVGRSRAQDLGLLASRLCPTSPLAARASSTWLTAQPLSSADHLLRARGRNADRTVGREHRQRRQQGGQPVADELLAASPATSFVVPAACHWQTPILALGAWAAGLTIAGCVAEPDRGAAATLPPGMRLAALAIGIGLAVSLHPWGLPLGSRDPVRVGGHLGADSLRGQAELPPTAGRWHDRPWVTDRGRPAWTAGALDPALPELGRGVGAAAGRTAAEQPMRPTTLGRAAGLHAWSRRWPGAGSSWRTVPTRSDVSRQEGNHATALRRLMLQNRVEPVRTNVGLCRSDSDFVGIDATDSRYAEPHGRKDADEHERRNGGRVSRCRSRVRHGSAGTLESALTDPDDRRRQPTDPRPSADVGRGSC